MITVGLRRFWLERTQRTGVWRKASKDHKKEHPRCEICGRTKKAEAHDVIPYRKLTEKQRNDYAFLRTNLLTLCGAPRDDHRVLAHCDDPKCVSFNPKIREMAAKVKDDRQFCIS